MVQRLVLGSGPLVRTVVMSLQNQPGGVHVLTADEGTAETLREDGIPVTVGDPASVDSYDGLDADLVAVFREDTTQNKTAARTASQVFPDAYLLADSGTDSRLSAQSGDRETLEEICDRVFDRGSATASYLMDRISDEGRQLRQLWSVLNGIERLAVVAHDNPDPDAIASGIALARLANSAGCDANVCYFGNINHQENRAFVNVLDLELQNIETADTLDAYDGIALVDHSRPGVNDQLPEDTQVDIVIDHHPPRAPVDAAFVDLRSDVGATSTLLVEYLDGMGLLPDQTVSTALLFGIHVDTDGFSREVSARDFHAAGILLPSADLGTLERIESPSMSPGTLETVAAAIRNRQIEGEILLTCVGQLSDRDALAQAADRLLMLDGVTTTVVYGFSDGTIYVSARSRGTDIDLGETLRDAFDQIGSAGGHVDMAGAQIGLGVLEAVEQREQSLTEIVEAVITNRFLESLSEHTDDRSVYSPVTTQEHTDGTIATPGKRQTDTGPQEIESPTETESLLYSEDRSTSADSRENSADEDT